MSVPTPHRGQPPYEPSGSSSRRSAVELARVYVSASAFKSAMEALDRLPANDWDEEVRLLRAEALIGLGRIPEADKLLGLPVLPIARTEEKKSEKQPDHEAANEAATRPFLPKGQLRAAKKRVMGRRERLSLWRFLLQLRVLHRTGNYRQVLQLGRAYFGSQRLQPSIYVARIATVLAQSTYALRRPSEAREMYEDVLELYKHLRSREGVADTLLGLAMAEAVPEPGTGMSMLVGVAGLVVIARRRAG